ncbi:MAG TPA: hypothetical protein VL285_07920 [Bryobacteraceae bacterium]|nr:hypothetical protein [Bryobacteraceae bacterium]
MKSGSAAPGASILLDFAVLFLLTAFLIQPLFKVKYMDKWASIESTFIADARFLKEHWPHPRWQPLWYGGTRFDYIYPPALRYGTAALAKFYPMNEARAYHLYTAFFYCAGIAGVYLLARVAGGSRGAAWLAAGAAAVISPSYLFLAAWRADSNPLHPLRLGVLVRYGEGPHISSLAVLPVALTFSLRALEAWRPPAMAAAAAGCALVVSTNFYGATALAICFPILVWSLWITRQDSAVWMRAAAVCVLAYGLTAFWLVPSYLRVTIANLRLVSRPGNTWSILAALALAAAFMALTAKWARGRRELFYLVFVAGFALFLALDVLGNYFAGFRVAGEPLRLVPELDLALLLLAAEGLRRLWSCGLPHRRKLAVALTLAGLAPAAGYLRHPWSIIVRYPDHRDRVEYKLAEWMGTHLPGARAMVTGSVRFWYDAWRDLAQVGGGSEQGVLNPVVTLAPLQTAADADAVSAIRWMQSYGVDAIVVNGRTSREIYHDWVYPEKFVNVLPVLHDDGEGNVIYRVPRRFPDLARVVESWRIRSIDPMALAWDPGRLQRYAAALEEGPDERAVMAWDGVDAFRIRAGIASGQALVAQVAYDPAWRAESDGAALVIHKDPFGQMLIEAPPGRHDIRVRFETPLENRIGQIVSLMSAIAAIALAGYRLAIPRLA